MPAEEQKHLKDLQRLHGLGGSIYPIERMNLLTGKPFEDGEHILATTTWLDRRGTGR